MTTAKQANANQANSQKSTGATTSSGKLAVSGNAIKHGLLSGKLILKGEAQGDYQALLDGLIQSLKPSGALELILVEKVAVAIWKQRRLVTAESAGIELDRRLGRKDNMAVLNDVLATTWDDRVTNAELMPLTDGDLVDLRHHKKIIAEIEALDQAVLDSGDLDVFRNAAPITYGELVEEAAEDEQAIETYVECVGGLSDWLDEVLSWNSTELKKYSRREAVQQVAELVTIQVSAPIKQELLGRYQASLDNELYKAIDALRKQQEWRSKGLVDVEMAA